MQCGGPLKTSAGAPAGGRCGDCLATLPKSRALALLDGVSHLLWIHGALGALTALGFLVGGLASGAQSPAAAVAMAGYGVVLLALSVVQIVAGVRLQEYRGWGLGVAACASTLVGVVGCGVVPSLLLCGTGLAILLNPGVRRAFADIGAGMDQREMERLHLPRDDEKFSLWYVAVVVVVSLGAWCLLGAAMSALGSLAG